MWWAVAVGGAIGATLRWAVQVWWERWVASTAWAFVPGGTLIVNVVGCFLLAWWSSSVVATEGTPMWARALVTTGVLGAFTTFSTFGVDAWRLLLDGRTWAAAGYVLVTLTTTGIAVILGWSLGSSLAASGRI